MRRFLLLMLVIGAGITQTASAQSNFHTDLGRHLGWGAGPGYHAYSQADVLGWTCHQHGAGCTSCGSPAAPDVFMIEPSTKSGVSRHASPSVDQQQFFPPAGQPAINGPRLAPAWQPAPQQVPPVQWAPPAAPPTAYRHPAATLYSPYHASNAGVLNGQMNGLTHNPTEHPLITPTGSAQFRSPRAMPTAAVAPQPVTYWVYPGGPAMSASRRP